MDVTDGRFVDSDPVFTVDGLYLAFLSRRTFDPIYDAHSFDLSFPFGARPYLVPLAAHTLSPFGPLPGGRPVGRRENAKDALRNGCRLTVDTDGISSRVVAVPVDEARYYGLAAVKGGLLWLRYPLSGVLGEGTADPDDDAPAARARAVRPAQARVERARRRGRAGSRSAATAPGSSSATAATCASSRRPQGRQRLVGRRGQRGPDPGAVPRRPGGAVAHAYAEFGRLLRRDFWTPDMSGVDWDGVLEEYRFLLDRIRTSAEFGDLLWEVAGELGTSHAYVMPSGTVLRTGRRSAAQPAALLGADVVRAPDGRWIVERVLPGESSDPQARSPFAAPGVAVRRGRRDPRGGRPPAGPGARPVAGPGRHRRQAGRADDQPADPSLVPRPPPKPTPRTRTTRRAATRQPEDDAGEALTPRSPDSADGAPGRQRPDDGHASRPAPSAAQGDAETRRVVVVPLHDDRRLRYQDWVAGRRAVRPHQVRRPGRLPARARHDGRGLGAPAPRPARRDGPRRADRGRARQPRRAHLAAHRGEARPPDHRLEDFGRYLRPYSYPQEAPRGPMVALADEFAGSDGDIVTAAIKSLGLGPVIGARTWGGVVGIDGGGHGLVDGTRITVPRYASWFNEFGWSVENYGVDPDTEVLITPDDWAAGHDPQLEVAVDRALALLDGEPAGPAARPVQPARSSAARPCRPARNRRGASVLPPGERDRDAEADHRETAGAADELEAPRRSREPRADPAGGQPPRAVGQHPDGHGNQGEQQHLRRDVPGAAVHELRQDRAEQDVRLRVRHADREPVPQRDAGLPGTAPDIASPSCWRCRIACTPSQTRYSAGQLDRDERLRRALEERAEADGDAGGHHVVAAGVPHGGRDGRPRRAPAHGRPRTAPRVLARR